MTIPTLGPCTDCGTNANYQRGCRCEDCTRAHRIAGKERGIYRLQHGSCRIPTERVTEALAPLLDMGVSLYAIADAAGIPWRSGSIGQLIEAGRSVNRGTYQRLANVTEDDLSDGALVLADLTRKRIYSLMAAGHQLNAMPLNPRGKWREYDRVTIGIARVIRDHYRTNEGRMGTSTVTASRARNAGHVIPAAWDDPGTLAWPNGTPMAEVHQIRPGRPDMHRAEDIEFLRSMGETDEAIATRLGITRETVRDVMSRTRRAS